MRYLWLAALEGLKSRPKKISCAFLWGIAVFETTPIKDLLIYKPKVFSDSRGYFFESFNGNHFAGQGINTNFVQDNRSRSSKGTLRGLHMQTGDYEQAKLVSVLKGHVYDVAVDLRPKSESFGQWHGVHLREDEPQSFYVPRGFAHGFIVLEDDTVFAYKCDNFYNKESEDGVVYNDPDLNIDWMLKKQEIILLEKDKNLKRFYKFAQS